jgi:hypothetical protein
VDVSEQHGTRQIDIEVPEHVAPGEEFEFEVALRTNFLDALLLRMTHMRRVFQATTTDAQQCVSHLRTLYHLMEDANRSERSNK